MPCRIGTVMRSTILSLMASAPSQSPSRSLTWPSWYSSSMSALICDVPVMSLPSLSAVQVAKFSHLCREDSSGAVVAGVNGAMGANDCGQFLLYSGKLYGMSAFCQGVPIGINGLVCVV